jgi:hypothetical protein
MTEQKQLNVDSQRRFRTTHRRIDYAPRTAIWEIIEQHFQGARVKSLTGVINKLIVAGHEAITGNLDELGIAGTRSTEDTVEIHQRPLTSLQEQFACTVATSNQSLTESYRQVYRPQNAKPETVNKMAARVAALPHVAARIRDLRGGMAAIVMRQAGYSRADAMREAGEVMERAAERGQIGTAVRALALRAKLAGLLPGTRNARRNKYAPQSDLTDADVASLIEMRDRILAEPQQAADALDLVGDPPGD